MNGIAATRRSTQPSPFLQHSTVSITGMPAHKPGPGRRSKGDRDAFYTRPPRAIGERIRVEADRLGVSYSDYIAALVADQLGMREEAPTLPDRAQQELPLKTA